MGDQLLAGSVKVTRAASPRTDHDQDSASICVPQLRRSRFARKKPFIGFCWALESVTENGSRIRWGGLLELGIPFWCSNNGVSTVNHNVTNDYSKLESINLRGLW